MARTSAAGRPDVPEADAKPDIAPSFIVRDGKLVSSASRFGHLVTEKEYANYRLTVEYRFTGQGRVTAACSSTAPPRARFTSMFPQSIEVRIQSGNP